MFVDNKYHRWYRQIMDRAKTRSLIDGYERHHIWPKSIGGNNSSENLVRLTYREHFLAHWLLIKFTEGSDRIKMRTAFAYMTNHSSSNSRNIEMSGWKFEIARKHKALATLAMNKQRWDSGYKFSLEALAKISATSKRQQEKKKEVYFSGLIFHNCRKNPCRKNSFRFTMWEFIRDGMSVGELISALDKQCGKNSAKNCLLYMVERGWLTIHRPFLVGSPLVGRVGTGSLASW